MWKCINACFVIILDFYFPWNDLIDINIFKRSNGTVRDELVRPVVDLYPDILNDDKSNFLEIMFKLVMASRNFPNVSSKSD